MQFVCAVLLAGVLFTAPATARPRGTVSAQTSGSCASAGYSGGCCTVGSCFVSTGGAGDCYCDEVCHQNGDCCSDIIAIGCEDKTCAGAGLSPGCCTPPGLACAVTPSSGPRCFCDILCHLFNDCCSDVSVGLASSCAWSNFQSESDRQKQTRLQTLDQREGGGRQGVGRLGASEDTTAQLLDAVLALVQRLNTAAAAATQQKHMK